MVCRPERRALRAVKLGLRMLDFVENFQQLSTGQVVSRALVAIEAAQRYFLSYTPPTAGLSR